MSKIDFNDGWIVYKKNNKADLKPVVLPYDAMIYEKRTPESAGGKHIGWFEGCDYVFEKDFFISDEYSENELIIEFEGVYRNAEVFINNTKAMFRPYGYTNFYVKLNDFIKYNQNNKIDVFVENSNQPNSRWYSGTGIYRPVNLYILPKKHIEINGIKIKTTDIFVPKIEVNIKTNCKGPLKVIIYDNDTIIGEAEAETDGNAKVELSLPNAKLWDSDNPKLYSCKVCFFDDVQECAFGIRTIDWSSKEGFLINGKRTLLLGACIHHDNGLLGAVAHPYAEYRKIKKLKEVGFNAIRSAHNPCSKALLDACDRLGMLVVDEYVDMWYIPKNKYDYAAHFEQWWKQDLKDMVYKDYNHPSVIMYSIGNEVAETSEKKGIHLCGEMTKYLKSLDYRPVTCGINIFFNYLYSLGFGVYSDKKAEKALKKKKQKAFGSEFFNNLAGIFGDKVMKIGATLRGSDLKTRDAFSQLDIAGYNYGILRYKKDVKKYPDRVILGTETFCKDACRFYEIARKEPAVIGDFVWAGIDYLGEAGIGAWVYKDYAKDFNYGVGWLTAGSGRLDITCKPNAEAAYMRVAYDFDKIRMAVVPADNYSKKHSPSSWKMSNALESWSFDNCEGKKTVVEIYSKAHKVALYINDKKIKEKKRKNKYNCIFYFHVKYTPGTLTAVAYDNNGNEIAKTSLMSAEKDIMLKVIPEEDSISSNDLCYARVMFADKKGTVKPLINSEVTVSVKNGSLIAFGNSCPYNEDGYLNDTAMTYYGEALAIIKPDSSKNDIIIEANSKFGNASATVRIV